MLKVFGSSKIKQLTHRGDLRGDWRVGRVFPQQQHCESGQRYQQ